MIYLLRKRRSILAYTMEPISRQQLELLVEALLRAPAAEN
jgi:nitroreductase